MSGIAFATLIILAYKEYKWLAYVIFSFLLILNAAAMDGSIAYLARTNDFFSGNDFILWVLPFLLTTSIASYGFMMIALRLESPHQLAKLSPVFFFLSFVSALFTISTAFWLEKISLTIMWVPANILFFSMIVCQILPPLTWPAYGRWLQLFIRAYPVFATLIALGGYWTYLLSSDANQQDLNYLYRWSLLLFAFFSLTTVIWQAFNNTRMKELAERKVIEADKNEAEMQLTLLQSEQAYNEALSAATKHRMQLATVSHDLKQPIIAMRTTAEQMYRNNHNDADKLAKAIDYIDSLSRSYASQDEIVARSGKTDDKETVATSMFCHALQQMFESEASHKNIQLRFIAMDHTVLVEPLSAMRVMTNLLSNALAHADASRILVGFRGKGSQVIFQVHDNGRGIRKELQPKLFALGQKGESSEGQGLGLGIVQELCRAQQMIFTLHSKEGAGTSAFIVMQRA